MARARKSASKFRVALEDERLAGQSTEALECHDRSAGHVWPRFTNTTHRKLIDRERVGLSTFVTYEITCMAKCNTVATDRWELAPDGRRYRVGQRRYVWAEGYLFKKPEGDGPVERITSADIGYAIMVRLMPELGL